MKLSDFNGQFFHVVRDGTFETLGNNSSSPRQSFLSYAENEAYLGRTIKNDRISCLICPPHLAEAEELQDSNMGIAVSDNPRLAFYEFHNWLAAHSVSYLPPPEKTVIGKNCSIHSSAVIAANGVVIGDDVIIEENAVIKPGAVIDNGVTISTGTIVAGENHIITRNSDGNLFLIKQTGLCHLHEGVVVGYHSMIARGTFPYDITSIGKNTKIENSVEVSHNSQIGENCIITGQCQVCGNTVVGNNSRLNPQSIISNRLTIGDGVTVEIGSVVVNDVKSNQKVAGNFAIEHMKFLLWHRKKLSGK